MWNKRPLDGIGPNPFGKADAGNEQLTADSSKCPSCGSNIVYAPELEAMMCRNCGNIYDPNTLESRGSFGVNKERDYTGDSDISEDDKRRHEIVCNSCGATLVADENTMSTMCPFCGSPALITRRMSREFKPDYIIPFKVDKTRAQKIMTEWLASRKYTPRGFKSKSRLTKMTALYVPFWLLDCVVTTELSGTGKRIRGYEKTIYEVNSTINYYVKGVPFDASLRVANKLMEAIEPFDYSELVRFEDKYLQGFYADKYDQLPAEMTERIVKRMNKFSNSESDLISSKYDAYEDRPEKSLTWMKEVSMSYCLLPVWFMTVEFDGRQYQFAINGQTGEASGQVPTSDTVYLPGKLRDFLNTKWIIVALGIFLVISFMLARTVSLPAVDTTKTTIVIFLSVLGAIDLIGSVVLLVLRSVLNRVFIGASNAYDINDFDEDPGLDNYFDLTRHADIKINETMLRHVSVKTDENGRVVGESSIEI